MKRHAVAIFLLLTAASEAAAQQTFAQSDEPIEVTGQRFEWIPDDKLVIVTGDPLAVQGETRIVANRFEVRLSDAEDNSAGGQSNDELSGEIETIHAEGDVRYATPAEVATGDWAVYDATTRTVTMRGNVVVTRAENVIRGERLVVNIDTGRSVIDSTRERVRGLFFTNSSSADAGGS